LKSGAPDLPTVPRTGAPVLTRALPEYWTSSAGCSRPSPRLLRSGAPDFPVVRRAGLPLVAGCSRCTKPLHRALPMVSPTPDIPVDHR